MDTEFYINKEKDNSHSIIIVIKNFFTSENIDYIYSNLNRMDDWRHGEAFGRPIPRLQKWYNVENKSFSPFWKNQHNRWDSLEYEQWLLDLQNNLFTKLNDSFSYLYDQIPSFRKIQFNSVLINKYRNGQDFIKQHKDDEKIFNDNPSIVSISFGASRDFTFKRILYDVNNVKSTRLNRKEQQMNKTIKLEHGTVLIMAGSTQKYYSHGVPIDSECTRVRYNMTFRNYNPIV
jgi:alkylated DNA repair dioxygenase AlkB